MSKPIRIIDSRNKQFFVVDDVYLNGYAKHLGPTASMVYISLCRHSAKDQTSFPSQKLIAEELGVEERTVMDKIKLLEQWNLVEVTRTKSTYGKWMNNTYVLLDKSVWISKPPAEKGQVETTYIKTAKPPAVFKQYKDTHKKYTHNKILEDEDFLKYASGDNSKINVLNERYPYWKFGAEWEEANRYKKEHGQ